MSASFSKTIVLGHVGRDPEFKAAANGTAVAHFSVATDESYKDSQGVKQERTEWHNVVAFARLAEVVRDYVRKGSLVMIEGRNKTRDWQDKDSGKTMYRTEILLANIRLLSKQDASGAQQNAGAAKPASADAAAVSNSKQAFDKAYADTEITDDDIPF